MRKEFLFSGSGGQGVITASIILAEAALYDGLVATQTQAYGPEARGGSARAEAIVSDEPIHYPKVTEPETYVIMSQAAYDKYGVSAHGDNLMLIDPGYVTSRPDCRYFEVPATSEAKKQLGKPVFANVVMLGALLEATGVVSYDALEHAVLDSVPKGTEEKNKQALEIGRELVRRQL